MKNRPLMIAAFLAIATPRVWGQPAMIADETGTVVFGQTPAKVEVMNLPETGGTPPEVVTLFDGAQAPGQTSIFSDAIPVDGFRSYVLFGDVRLSDGGLVAARFNCYASLEPWETIHDAVPKAVSFVGKVDSGFIFVGSLGVQQKNPILGPYLKCAFANDHVENLVFTLKAYLTN